MLIPNKFENLNKNLMVIGACVIKELNKSSANIEDLFSKLKEKRIIIGLDQYFDVLTFLWISDVIDLKKYQACIKK
ncbi:MAG: hypothetical protein WC477_02325 [Patescibacteria group bacterium]